MGAYSRILSTLLAAGTLALASLAEAANEGSLDAGYVNPGHVDTPAWFKNSFLDLREDVAEAADNGKRLVLYFYQDGCPYCEKLIRTNFHQDNIVDYARDHFDFVAINLWGDRSVTDLDGSEKSEKQFAVGLRVQFTPTLLFLNEQGGLALRINGYYPPHKFLSALTYVAEKRETRERFADYFARLNPSPASGKLHIEPAYLQPPYDLSKRKGNKPLLVLFEQKDCPVCDEFHGDAFRRPISQKLLGQFDVAVVDTLSRGELVTPDGKKTSAADWARALKVNYIPTMAFFDRGGKEVFRSEAYLRPFHLQSVLEYVASGAYRTEPEFQRFVQSRADHMRERGETVEIWK